MSAAFIIPPVAEKILGPVSLAFTRPTAARFLLVVIGLILTFGRRTVTGVLWTMRIWIGGHYSTYHRLFSRARWSLWTLGRILATLIIETLKPNEEIVVVIDDTTAGHRGKRVYGKGCHHDAVRSTHTHLVWRWGHRWIVLAICVRWPFVSRPWALPVLMALYKSQELNLAETHRHKTATLLARQLVATLIHWFPGRKFIVLGDGGYASHEFAGFFQRHGSQVTLVSRFHPDAALHDPPPSRRKTNGRPRTKGNKLPRPSDEVRKQMPMPATVRWYGGSPRKVELVSGTGLWYKTGQGLVAVRWVFVRDKQGTHRDEYFYTTDPSLTPERIVSLFTARWSIETTFQEMRTHLGFETTKQWTKQSVLRMAPLLLGLFSVISLIYARDRQSHRVRIRATPWYVKTEPTFSDAIATVRRLFWEEILFKHPCFHEPVQKLSARFRQLLLERLAGAA
jgi:hypothetical protein